MALVSGLMQMGIASTTGQGTTLFESDGLAQLLHRPIGTWMGGDVAMDQAPAVVLDHNKDVQQRKVAVTATKKSQAMIP
jgi:hypothetical protein